MPVIEIGTFTLPSSGSTTIFFNTITGTPYKLRFIVAGKYGGDAGNARVSDGTTNGTQQQYSAFISSSTIGAETDYGSNKVISHWGGSGGTRVKVLEATLTGVDDGEFTLNVTNPNSNFQVTVIAEADS